MSSPLDTAIEEALDANNALKAKIDQSNFP